MCYAPAKRSIDLSERARQRIAEGKLEEAERLLAIAKHAVGRATMNFRMMDGRRVGDHYHDAVMELTAAKRTTNGSTTISNSSTNKHHNLSFP